MTQFNRVKVLLTGHCLHSCRRLQLMKQLVKILLRCVNRKRLLYASGDGFQSLVSITRNADDDRFVTRDLPIFDKFLGDGNLGSASGLREDAFGLSEQLDAAENFLVRDAFAPTARLADRL